MLARTVDSVKFAPPTTTGPLPFCKPVVTPLLSTQPDATSTALLSSRSTAAFIFTRSSVVSCAETAFSAGSSAGLACAAAAFTAGARLSSFCRCLSSSRTTSLSPATGAQALPAAAPLPLALLPPPVPEEPDWPQPATSAAARSNGGTIRLCARISPAFCVPCGARRRDACLAGGFPRRSSNRCSLGQRNPDQLSDLLRAAQHQPWGPLRPPAVGVERRATASARA